MARAQRRVRARPPVGAGVPLTANCMIRSSRWRSSRPFKRYAYSRPSDPIRLSFFGFVFVGSTEIASPRRSSVTRPPSSPATPSCSASDGATPAASRASAPPTRRRASAARSGRARRGARSVALSSRCRPRAAALAKLAASGWRKTEIARRSSRAAAREESSCGGAAERGSVRLQLGKHGSSPPSTSAGSAASRRRAACRCADARRLVVERLHAPCASACSACSPAASAPGGSVATQLADHRVELCVERRDAAAPLRRERPTDCAHLPLPLVAVVVVVALLAAVRRAAAAPVAAAARRRRRRRHHRRAAADDRGIENELRKAAADRDERLRGRGRGLRGASRAKS